MKIGKLTIKLKIAWDEDNYMRNVKNFLRKGYKLSAIKCYHEATGESLRESVEAIKKLYPKYLKENKIVKEGIPEIEEIN
jgi:ribosomal protein L7/L12